MFIYFDLGNVIAMFDHQQGCRQMAAVAGVPAEQIWKIVFEGDLNRRYDLGEISTADFYEEFCRQTGKRPDLATMLHAAGDIFQLNRSLIPVIAQLEAAGYRLGILSNTNECHWRFVANGRYGLLPRAFSVHALSYEIGALKPDPKIYRAAAELASVAPEEIFFCDDIAGHVVGAREAGFDAVQYTTTKALVADLRQRGIRFNY